LTFLWPSTHISGTGVHIYFGLEPSWNICPKTMNTKDEQYHALEGRKIDLGFVYLRARPTGRDLQWTCVGYDVIMAAVAERSPLAQKRVPPRLM
jgi:hypothetical protein